MRNLTLSIITLGACFLVFTNVQAQAEVVYFPFEDLGSHSDNSSDEKIGEYMTGIMGSNVTVMNAQLSTNIILPFIGSVPWLGKAPGDYYLKTDDEKYMEILFETPITRVQGDGFVFIPGFDPVDFIIIGYDGLTEINRFEKNTGFFEEFQFDLLFNTPVDRLYISDNHKEFVAVDNLYVTPVPVPGAGLLGIIGMGVTGWLKRRKTL